MVSRREFLQSLAASTVLVHPIGCKHRGVGASQRDHSKMTEVNTQDASAQAEGRMPVVFVGHGSPMNVVEDNRWSRGFAQLRELVARPQAILSISAHWFVDGTYLTGSAQPKTIHDFSGFPQALYEVDYPAPGKVDLAEHVRALLGEQQAALSTQWGLDHGTWSVLRWMFPEADIPVVQLSIDRRLTVGQHYELARSLKALRHQGVLVLGSGNVVHNLRGAFAHMQTMSTTTPVWARHFDETVKHATLQHDTKTLLALWDRDRSGRLAHPTPDHWLPLIYALALTDPRDEVRFPTEGFAWGSLSMRNVLWG